MSSEPGTSSSTPKTPLDLDLIRKQAMGLVYDTNSNRNGNFTKKYNYLYTNVAKLYTVITRDIQTNQFNLSQFIDTLDKMLDLLKKIQYNEETQHSASVRIGEKLCKEYILPKLQGLPKGNG